MRKNVTKTENLFWRKNTIQCFIILLLVAACSGPVQPPVTSPSPSAAVDLQIPTPLSKPASSRIATSKPVVKTRIPATIESVSLSVTSLPPKPTVIIGEVIPVLLRYDPEEWEPLQVKSATPTVLRKSPVYALKHRAHPGCVIRENTSQWYNSKWERKSGVLPVGFLTYKIDTYTELKTQKPVIRIYAIQAGKKNLRLEVLAGERPKVCVENAQQMIALSEDLMISAVENNGEIINKQVGILPTSLSAPATVQESPKTLSLAFSCGDSDPYDICAIQADGAGLRNLTNTPSSSDIHPSCSRSGLSIAFTHDQTVAWINQEGKILRSLDRRSMTGDNLYPSRAFWAPDETRIVFSARKEPDQDGVYVVGTSGGEDIQVFSDRGTSYFSPGWSPNGLWLHFYTQEESRGFQLVTSDRNENFQNQVLPDGYVIDVSTQPSWSADSSKFAYGAQNKSTHQRKIFINSIEENEVMELTNGFEPSWSPVDDTIVFDCPDKGICAIKMNGGDIIKLSQAGYGPSWSPDGTKIAFSLSRTGGAPGVDLWVMDADGNNPKLLSPFSGISKDYCWFAASPVSPANTSSEK